MPYLIRVSSIPYLEGPYVCISYFLSRAPSTVCLDGPQHICTYVRMMKQVQASASAAHEQSRFQLRTLRLVYIDRFSLASSRSKSSLESVCLEPYLATFESVIIFQKVMSLDDDDDDVPLLPRLMPFTYV